MGIALLGAFTVQFYQPLRRWVSLWFELGTWLPAVRQCDMAHKESDMAHASAAQGQVKTLF